MDHNQNYSNPKDMIDSTYNGELFPIIERRTNALVMPLDMVRDIDALDSSRFYRSEWNKELKND